MSKAKEQIEQIKVKLGAFFEKVGALTKVQRLVICVVTFALIGGGYYYFIFMPKNEQLKKVKKTYQDQLKKLTSYKSRASQIAKYEKMMAKAQGEFNLAMRALPDKRELPSLLTGISTAGARAGLTFHLFQPGGEVNKEFYKEIPVSIKVAGRYHQLTDFFYQVTRLNRIVNINNVKVEGKKGGGSLDMTCKAVTYMFVEKKDQPQKGKRSGRKK